MQGKQPLQIDQHLIGLLEGCRDIPLSTTELRDLYLKGSLAHEAVNSSALRKYIYRELLRLESVKVVKRYNGEKGRGCKFIYAGEPEQRYFDEKPSPFLSTTHNIQVSQDAINKNMFKALEEELAQRKVELIVSIGEAEEFQRLCKKFPALPNTIRSQSLESRDRSSKLLGQLRAVETILVEIGRSA